MTKFKITMIHDLVCSWCHIGYHNIKSALAQMDDDIEVTFNYLPFELNSRLEADGIEIEKYFVERHGWSKEKHEHYRSSLMKTAKTAGAHIDFNYRTHYYNTHLAHRLIAEAENSGQSQVVHEALLRAYHSDGLNISDPEVLNSIAASLGLEQEHASKALDRNQASHRFNQARQRAQQHVLQSVPAWVINDLEFISGSKSTVFFRDYFNNLIIQPKQLKQG